MGCDAAIARSTCLDKGSCLTIGILTTFRQKMHKLTGLGNETLWIGEMGWSTPQSSTLNTPVKDCPDFSSTEVFESNYRNFLSWDLDIPKDVGTFKGPDHVFYFTMRD